MRPALVLGFALLLSGCWPSVWKLDRLPESEPLGQAVLINRPGPLRHEPSGFEFAEWYDSFQRVTAYGYDTAGLDVAIGYNDRGPDCLLLATFYVYPTPRVTHFGAGPDVVAALEQGFLDAELTRVREEIERYHPAMHSVVVGSATTPARRSVLRGHSLTFRESEKISELRLFVLDHQWFLKYRFTYPESCREEAARRLERLISRLPWA
jgi:hypothetical protein